MSFLDEGAEDVGADAEEDSSADATVSNYSPASSAIVRMTYHHDTSDLFITFKDGRGYVLPNFPEIELERWVNAPSVGGYFNAFVRGNY